MKLLGRHESMQHLDTPWTISKDRFWEIKELCKNPHDWVAKNAKSKLADNYLICVARRSLVQNRCGLHAMGINKAGVVHAVVNLCERPADPYDNPFMAWANLPIEVLLDRGNLVLHFQLGKVAETSRTAEFLGALAAYPYAYLAFLKHQMATNPNVKVCWVEHKGDAIVCHPVEPSDVRFREDGNPMKWSLMATGKAYPQGAAKETADEPCMVCALTLGTYEKEIDGHTYVFDIDGNIIKSYPPCATVVAADGRVVGVVDDSEIALSNWVPGTYYPRQEDGGGDGDGDCPDQHSGA